MLSKFTTNAAPLDPDEARLTVYHTAAAPGVDVRLNDDSGRVAVIKGLINGEASFPAEVPGGTYTALVSPSTPSGVGFNSPIAEIPIDPIGGSGLAVFAVGSLEGGTFTVIPVTTVSD